MAIKCGFFNSINNDRLYNANDMSNYFEGLISDGVYNNVGQACIVKANGGLKITVGTGRAIISNKWVRIDSPEILTLFPSPSLSRYVAVCLRLNVSKREIKLDAIHGTASASPTPPVVTNTDNEKYLTLAHVLLHANATFVSQSHITDMRAYPKYCGWVTGLVQQVDTSELFLQFQTAYEEKLQEINEWKADLDRDGLFARVEELFAKVEELENSTAHDGAFTKTIGGAVNFTAGNMTRTLDIGFIPKQFEIYGLGSIIGVYLQWDNVNGWSGNAGFLYNYNVDMNNNTITISARTTSEDLIWRAFG